MEKNKFKEIHKMIHYMAVGDSNGFAYENMSPQLINKIKPKVKTKISIKGNPLMDDMITDDTEHMLFTFKALKLSAHSEHSLEQWKHQFSTNLEREFKRWFATFPAGIEKATLISGFRLTFGKHYPDSAYYSAGNGPLMRAPLLGVYFHDDSVKRREAVKISTLMTHSHPFALLSSQILSEISALLFKNPELKNNKEKMLSEVFTILYAEKEYVTLKDKDNKTWQVFLNSIHSLNNLSKDVFLEQKFPKGVTGFCLNTLKICICQLYYNSNIDDTLKDTLYAGGDTDTSSGISACVFSLFLPSTTDISISKLEKRVNYIYPVKLLFSFVGWMKSYASLLRFLYIFK